MRIIDILLEGKKATQYNLGGFYFIEDNKIKFCNIENDNEIWESFYIKNDFLLEKGEIYEDKFICPICGKESLYREDKIITKLYKNNQRSSDLICEGCKKAIVIILEEELIRDTFNEIVAAKKTYFYVYSKEENRLVECDGYNYNFITKEITPYFKNK